MREKAIFIFEVSKIWRHYRVPRSRFPYYWRRNVGDSPIHL